MEIILRIGSRSLMLEPFATEADFDQYLTEFTKRCNVKEIHPTDKRELKRITDNLFETL